MKGLAVGPFTLPVIDAPKAGDAKETANARATRSLSAEHSSS
jgi:hypothetical protein